MRKFSAQKEEMMNLVSCKDVGIIRLETQELKDFFVPSPTMCLDNIATLMPMLGAELYAVR